MPSGLLVASATHRALVVLAWEWVALVAILVGFILLDLLVSNRGNKIPSTAKAATQTGMWVGVGALLGLLIVLLHGGSAGMEYYTGWTIEYSLSMDNVFVWGLILDFFVIQAQYRRRLLFWGIFGTLIMRVVFILLGVGLIEKLSWMIIVLGLALIWSALSLIRGGGENLKIGETRTYRFFSWILPIAEGDYGTKFFVRQGSKLMVTMFAVCLLVLTVVNEMFATDSVPAILSVAHDPFVIFASNAMAIMGLRALFFLLDSAKAKFTRLSEGLAIILGTIGLKMVLSSDVSMFGWLRMPGIEVPTWVSLTFVATVLACSVVASKVWPKVVANNNGAPTEDSPKPAAN